MDKKLGVYICSGCGLGETLDIGELEKVGTKELKAPVCRTHQAMCSPEGVELIKNDIENEGVNTIVIAACSPRVMWDVFSFDGCIVDRVNLREQVVWCTEPNEELDDPNEDIQLMAEDYLVMSGSKVNKMELPEPYQPEQEISKDILVIGGGISGMTSALECARAGYKVILVEKEKELGGFQKHVQKRITFPYHEPEANPLNQLIEEIQSNDLIKVYTDAHVEQTIGGPCLFDVHIRQNGSAPKKKEEEGEEGEEPIKERAGAVVLAPGWTPYDPEKLPERFGYGKSPKIVTNAQFEETKRGEEKHDNVVFLQCAGSRDQNHLPYCSTICCLASLKQAVQLKETNPDANVIVVFREMRTPGQAEDFYRAAQEKGVLFVRSQEPEVEVSGDQVSIKALDEVLGEEITIDDPDLVVLATGMVPVTGFGVDVKAKELAEEEEKPAQKKDDTLPVPVDVIRASDCLNLDYRQGPELPDLKYGFPDSHFICFPYESRRTGIYASGCVRRPMGAAAVYEDAAGAAMKAIQCVEMVAEGMAVHPRSGDLSYPEIYFSRCTQCRRCTDECPFGAYNEDEKSYPVPVPTRCRRCGVCMGACPERIISFKNYSVDMIGTMLKKIEMPEEDEEKPRVLVFACENDAYPALDMLGMKLKKISPYIRVIPLRCLGSLNLVWIADALSTGYDGVLLFGCKYGDDYQCHFIRGSELANIRMSKISETLTRLSLEEERIRVEQLAINDWERIPEIIEEFMETIDDVGPNPFKDL
jgi:quinone-modifying oxidoreductase subunit QmoB